MREVELTPISYAEAREAASRQIENLALYCWEVNEKITAIAGHAPVVNTDSDAIGRGRSGLHAAGVSPPRLRERRHGARIATTHRKGARVMLFATPPIRRATVSTKRSATDWWTNSSRCTSKGP